MKNPFFSIILPIYNVEKYLDRCVDSVVNQDFDDYEMILVDDGSTDNCPKICDNYAEKYPFVKVVHKRNGGLSSARNAGLEVASGKYVFWIDSDDWIQPNTFKTIYNALLKNSVDVLKINFYMQPSKQISKSTILPGLYQKEDISTWIIKEALINTSKINFSAWSHVYRRDFLLDNNLIFISEREIGSEDYLFNFQVYMVANSMLVLEEALYNYDLRYGSLTQRYRVSLDKQYRKLFEYIRNYAIQKKIYNKIKSDLDYFYVWQVLYVVMRNECKITPEHSVNEGKRNIKLILEQKELRDAIESCSIKKESFKRKILFIAMKLKNSFFIYIWLRHSVRKK